MRKWAVHYCRNAADVPLFAGVAVFVRFRVSSLCLLVIAGGVLVPSAFAQATTALVRATVVDPQGRAVPQVVVTIQNTATGVSREGVSGTDGVVTLSQLF